MRKVQFGGPALRVLAAGLSVAIAATQCGAAALAMAGGDIGPACDETYYATLDYYGGIQEGGVVKSYRLDGASELKDYGWYDEVVNLTDDTRPAVKDGEVVFHFTPGQAPDRFYFEGKTTQPFSGLPWKISLSYKLNGERKKAEELGGAAGLIEIDIDVIPNAYASEYSRDNFVLEAVAAFNADDILSLEAPGAQVQMIGNLRTVLFIAMPGEEQHYAIRVGSDDFTFSGVMFMAEPATLAQIGRIADIKRAKEEAEDSLDEISESMDLILDSLDGMSGSLRRTADGLDSLNQARATISAGKSRVYGKADAVLSALSGIADALEPLGGRLTTAGCALTDITHAATALSNNALELKAQLEESRKTVDALQRDCGNLRDLIDNLGDRMDRKDVESLQDDLSSDIRSLNADLGSLETSLRTMRAALGKLSSGALTEIKEITYNGLTVDEIESYVNTAANLYHQYEQYVAGYGYTGDFQTFLTGVAGLPAEKAELLSALWTASQSDDFQDQIERAKTFNSLLGPVNDKIRETNTLIGGVAQATSGVLSKLEALCAAMGTSGLGGDLEDAEKVLGDVADILDDHRGESSKALSDLSGMGEIIKKAADNAETDLDLIDALDDTVNEYVPDIQRAMDDLKDLNTSAQNGIKCAQAFLQAMEDLMRKSGTETDAGLEKTLSGLADSLRRSASGLDGTSNIRSAKDAIKELAEDEWNDHTGAVDHLLDMDAGAKPVSLTSDRNGSPASVQVILRTQEIKKPGKEESGGQAAHDAACGSGFFSRVGNMFRDIWLAIIGLFRRG